MFFPNLPSTQQATQDLADQFNREEAFWRSLSRKRRLRRKLMPWLTENEHKTLDELEFSRRRPPEDCIGRAL